MCTYCDSGKTPLGDRIGCCIANSGQLSLDLFIAGADTAIIKLGAVALGLGVSFSVSTTANQPRSKVMVAGTLPQRGKLTASIA